MDAPAVPFQKGHVNDVVRVSSTNNQTQISVPGSAPIVDGGLYFPAPVQNGDEMLHRGDDNANFEYVVHSSSA